MPKNNQSKQVLTHGNNKASQSDKLQPKIDLQFKDPKPSDDQIKAKFYKVDDNASKLETITLTL